MRPRFLSCPGSADGLLPRAGCSAQRGAGLFLLVLVAAVFSAAPAAAAPAAPLRVVDMSGAQHHEIRARLQAAGEALRVTEPLTPPGGVPLSHSFRHTTAASGESAALQVVGRVRGGVYYPLEDPGVSNVTCSRRGAAPAGPGTGGSVGVELTLQVRRLAAAPQPGSLAGALAGVGNGTVLVCPECCGTGAAGVQLQAAPHAVFTVVGDVVFRPAAPQSAGGAAGVQLAVLSVREAPFQAVFSHLRLTSEWTPPKGGGGRRMAEPASASSTLPGMTGSSSSVDLVSANWDRARAAPARERIPAGGGFVCQGCAIHMEAGYYVSFFTDGPMPVSADLQVSGGLLAQGRLAIDESVFSATAGEHASGWHTLVPATRVASVPIASVAGVPLVLVARAALGAEVRATFDTSLASEAVAALEPLGMQYEATVRAGVSLAAGSVTPVWDLSASGRPDMYGSIGNVGDAVPELIDAAADALVRASVRLRARVDLSLGVGSFDTGISATLDLEPYASFAKAEALGTPPPRPPAPDGSTGPPTPIELRIVSPAEWSLAEAAPWGGRITVELAVLFAEPYGRVEVLLSSPLDDCLSQTVYSNFVNSFERAAGPVALDDGEPLDQPRRVVTAIDAPEPGQGYYLRARLWRAGGSGPAVAEATVPFSVARTANGHSPMLVARPLAWTVPDGTFSTPDPYVYLQAGSDARGANPRGQTRSGTTAWAATTRGGQSSWPARRVWTRLSDVQASGLLGGLEYLAVPATSAVSARGTKLQIWDDDYGSDDLMLSVDLEGAFEDVMPYAGQWGLRHSVVSAADGQSMIDWFMYAEPRTNLYVALGSIDAAHFTDEDDDVDLLVELSYDGEVARSTITHNTRSVQFAGFEASLAELQPARGQVIRLAGVRPGQRLTLKLINHACYGLDSDLFEQVVDLQPFPAGSFGRWTFYQVAGTSVEFFVALGENSPATGPAASKRVAAPRANGAATRPLHDDAGTATRPRAGPAGPLAGGDRAATASSQLVVPARDRAAGRPQAASAFNCAADEEPWLDSSVGFDMGARSNGWTIEVGEFAPGVEVWKPTELGRTALLEPTSAEGVCQRRAPSDPGEGDGSDGGDGDGGGDIDGGDGSDGGGDIDADGDGDGDGDIDGGDGSDGGGDIDADGDGDGGGDSGGGGPGSPSDGSSDGSTSSSSTSALGGVSTSAAGLAGLCAVLALTGGFFLHRRRRRQKRAARSAFDTATMRATATGSVEMISDAPRVDCGSPVAVPVTSAGEPGTGADGAGISSLHAVQQAYESGTYNCMAERQA